MDWPYGSHPVIYSSPFIDKIKMAEATDGAVCCNLSTQEAQVKECFQFETLSKTLKTLKERKGLRGWLGVKRLPSSNPQCLGFREK